MKPMIAGAMIGAASSAVMGKDPLKGAVLGGISGGISGGFGSGAETLIDPATGEAIVSSSLSSLPTDAMNIDPSNLMGVGGIDEGVQLASNSLPTDVMNYDPSNLMGLDGANSSGLFQDANLEGLLPTSSKNMFGLDDGGIPLRIADTPSLLKQGLDGAGNELTTYGKNNPTALLDIADYAITPPAQEPTEHANATIARPASIDTTKFQPFNTAPINVAGIPESELDILRRRYSQG